MESESHAQTYTHKPAVVVAIRWNGDNFEQVKEFTKGLVWVATSFNAKTLIFEGPYRQHVYEGDYITLGEDGTYQVVRQEVFFRNYNAMENDNEEA